MLHVQTNLQVTFETLSQISRSNGVMCLCTSDGESCDQKSLLTLMSYSLGLLEKCFYIFECRKWICFGLNSNLSYFFPSLGVTWSSLNLMNKLKIS